MSAATLLNTPSTCGGRPRMVCHPVLVALPVDGCDGGRVAVAVSRTLIHFAVTLRSGPYLKVLHSG